MTLRLALIIHNFDLTEGESEVVSGFNVEYRSFLLAMFFLAEYIHVLLMSVKHLSSICNLL